MYIQALMDKKFKMGMSNINEALPALLRFIGLVLSCLVLTTVSGAIRLITAFGYFLVGVIEGSTGASPKKYMKFHTQRHENTNLLYNGNANSSVIDERLTLFNSLSQVKSFYVTFTSYITNILLMNLFYHMKYLSISFI